MSTATPKKSRKALIIIGIIIAVIVLLAFMADGIVSNIAEKQFRKQMDKVLPGRYELGGLRVCLSAGTLTLTDFAITTGDSMVLDKTKPGLALRVGKLSVRDLRIFAFARKRELPDIRLKIENLDFAQVQDKDNPDLHLILAALEAEAHDLGYNFQDSTFLYNDSIYSISLSGLHLLTPDSLTAIEVAELRTANAGPLAISGLRVYNTVDRRELALRKDSTPNTWADMMLGDILTSPVNIIRMALSQQVAIDSVHVHAPSGLVFRDSRFPPKQPYPMPQEVIRAIPVPIAIGNVDVRMDQLNIEIATTDINTGKLALADMRVEMKGVSNKPNAAIRCLIHEARIGKSSSSGSFVMHLNKNCTFETQVLVHNFRLANMDSLLCPLIGITASAEVEKLSAKIQGDKVSSSGEFCMCYHDFGVVVHKDVDVPYQFITNNAAFLESVANNLLPKANPNKLNTEPRAYKVEWKRDEMMPFPFYMFGPVIDGAVKTFLPGLFVHDRIRDGKRPISVTARKQAKNTNKSK